MRQLVLIILLTSSCITAGLAQQGRKGVLQLGVRLQGLSYLGDLTVAGERFHRFNPGANFSMQFSNHKRLQLQLNSGFARFTAQQVSSLSDNSPAVSHNTFVETQLFYSDLRLRWNLIRHRPIKPYVAVGAGLMFFTPKDKLGNNLGENRLSRADNEDYSTVAGNIPLAVGVEYAFNKKVSLSAEYTFHAVQSDYLDNVGTLGAQQGNDKLHAFQLGVSFTLHAKPQKKPVYQKPVESSAPAVAARWAPNRQQGRSTNARNADLYSMKLGAVRVPQKAIRPIAPPTLMFTQLNTFKAIPLQIDWEAREKAAVKSRRFFYHQVDSKDSLQKLAEQYHVQVSTLKKVNYLSSDDLSGSRMLRIPDVRISL